MLTHCMQHTTVRDVTNSPPLNLRIDQATLHRLDRVAQALSARAEGANITRSDATRAALSAGLTVLEAKLGIAEPTQKEKPKPTRKC
jgi:hypothetical protein